MKQTYLLFFVLTLLAIPAVALGQLPRTLSYQGVLTDTLGNPKSDGTYLFTFRLYEGSSGGTAIWSEQKTLAVKRGLFSTLLGDQVIIGNAIRFDRPYWLGIQLAADPEMVPRIEMSSVGYSRRAEKADTATYALSAPAQFFVDSARVAATIPDGVVTTNKLANNSVTSGKIASAQVVKSINSLKDDVTLSAGSNVTITPSGNTLTIAASGGGGGNVSGTGAASQVPFWTGTSSIGGDNGFAWNNATKTLGIGTTSTVSKLYVSSVGMAILGASTATTGLNTIGVNGSSLSSDGIGVQGYAQAVSGATIGVYGQAESPDGRALSGNATALTGTNYGVYGWTNSPSGNGVRGQSPGVGVQGIGITGVLGTSSISSGGTGVYGLASSATGTTYGLAGLSNSSDGTGVYGVAQSPTGVTYGVYGASSSSLGRGLKGLASSTTGTTYGLYGQSNSSSGTGVYGEASSATGATYGLYGLSNSSSGMGVYALASSAAGTTSGIYAENYSSSGIGVRGIANAATGSTRGVYGLSNSSSGTGVYGLAAATSGATNGVVGFNLSSGGTGVSGYASSTTGDTYGVTGQNNSPAGAGVSGFASSATGFTYGVDGASNSSDGTGVNGFATSTTGTNFGVFGRSASSSGRGVYGITLSSTGTTYGVHGYSSSSSGAGVYGQSISRDGVVGTGQRWGVYGTNYAGTPWGYLAGSTTGVYGNAGGVGTNRAGIFDGNVDVNGTLSKSAGSFKIDHPLDPANKYLYHSFVESPDMMNVYNGNVTLNANGEAWVELPAYFEVLNSDYRYQLTAIGAPGPNLHIARKISGNRFKIAGGQPGMEVSWQATGIRQDAFAKAHRIIPEVEKTGKERGKYIHPKEHGVSEMMGEDYDEIHKIEEEQTRMKAMDDQQRIKAREERDRMQIEGERAEQQRRQVEEQRVDQQLRQAEEQRMSRERR